MTIRYQMILKLLPKLINYGLLVAYRYCLSGVSWY